MRKAAWINPGSSTSHEAVRLLTSNLTNHPSKTKGHTNVGRPAKTYIYQLCVDTGHRVGDLWSWLMAKERRRNPCCRHALMMLVMIKNWLLYELYEIWSMSLVSLSLFSGITRPHVSNEFVFTPPRQQDMTQSRFFDGVWGALSFTALVVRNGIGWLALIVSAGS